MEVQEIDDVSPEDPVDQVARYPAAQEPEADLRIGSPEPEGLPPQEDHDEGRGRERGEKEAPAGEDAPGRPRVAHVDNVEEPAHDRDRARRLAIGPKGQM